MKGINFYVRRLLQLGSVHGVVFVARRWCSWTLGEMSATQKRSRVRNREAVRFLWEKERGVVLIITASVLVFAGRTVAVAVALVLAVDADRLVQLAQALHAGKAQTRTHCQQSCRKNTLIGGN